MAFGQDELEAFLDTGALEETPPDRAGAEVLIAKARAHHSTAQAVAHTDPEIAADALHAGNRKALEAVLLVRGLRPAKSAGHGVPAEAVRSMMDAKSAFRTYDTVRRIRNAGDYQSAEYDVNPVDIIDNLPDSTALVDACEKALDILPPFVRGR